MQGPVRKHNEFDPFSGLSALSFLWKINKKQTEKNHKNFFVNYLAL